MLEPRASPPIPSNRASKSTVATERAPIHPMVPSWSKGQICCFLLSSRWRFISHLRERSVTYTQAQSGNHRLAKSGGCRENMQMIDFARPGIVQDGVWLPLAGNRAPLPISMGHWIQSHKIEWQSSIISRAESFALAAGSQLIRQGSQKVWERTLANMNAANVPDLYLFAKPEKLASGHATPQLPLWLRDSGADGPKLRISRPACPGPVTLIEGCTNHTAR